MSPYDPDGTREKLLQAAHAEMYEAGFATASLDGIVGRAGVTKGALYHHFGGKKELCLAAVAETVLPWVERTWLEPLARTRDPLEVLAGILRNERESKIEQKTRFGCPLNNLSQELSSLDDDVRRQLQAIVDRWIGGIRDALSRGQGAGTVREDLDPAKVAAFLVASLEGAVGLAKSTRSAEMLRGNYDVLIDFLGSLAPA